ncbi:MAG: rod shape-determining protein MreC, partial [Acetatifactor sp.]|nr:rod shape-determining protein MreC [Acetatifactor sp.]
MSPIIKRKGEKFTLPGKYLLFILTAICVCLMFLTFGTNVFNKPLNTALGYAVIPFQQGISKAGEWLSRRSEELVQIRVLLDENARLKAEVAALTEENTLLQQDKYELNQLRALIELDEQYGDYEKIGARIISRDSGNWYSSFIIDKGSDDGLCENMNVIAGGGLVGRITATGPNWSRVTAIISDNSNVSAMTLATGDKMMVSGDLQMMAEGVITFSKLVDSKNVVVEGDKIVTSDISDKYLPNILIGYIHT